MLLVNDRFEDILGEAVLAYILDTFLVFLEERKQQDVSLPAIIRLWSHKDIVFAFHCDKSLISETNISSPNTLVY